MQMHFFYELAYVLLFLLHACCSFVKPQTSGIRASRYSDAQRERDLQRKQVFWLHKKTPPPELCQNMGIASTWFLVCIFSAVCEASLGTYVLGLSCHVMATAIVGLAQIPQPDTCPFFTIQLGFSSPSPWCSSASVPPSCCHGPYLRIGYFRHYF